MRTVEQWKELLKAKQYKYGLAEKRLQTARKNLYGKCDLESDIVNTLSNEMWMIIMKIEICEMEDAIRNSFSNYAHGEPDVSKEI